MKLQIKQGGINEQGREKKFGLIIKQAKNFASRVAKNLKIVPEHACLFRTGKYLQLLTILCLKEEKKKKGS